jgi:hypothetical protein
MERPDDVEAAAAGVESDIADLERRSSRVDEHIDEARQDWRRKQQDPGVPGAEPSHNDEAGGDVAGDWSGEGKSASDAGQ